MWRHSRTCDRAWWRIMWEKECVCVYMCDWVTLLYHRKLIENCKPPIMEKIKIILKNGDCDAIQGQRLKRCSWSQGTSGSVGQHQELLSYTISFPMHTWQNEAPSIHPHIFITYKATDVVRWDLRKAKSLISHVRKRGKQSCDTSKCHGDVSTEKWEEANRLRTVGELSS